MAPLSATVRPLVRLYLDGVEGAREVLAQRLETDRDALAAELGVSADALSGPDALSSLVSAIEQGTRAARMQALARRRAEAAALAHALGHTARCVEADVLQLDAALLRGLVDTWPGRGVLGFGHRGALDLTRLRALLHRCASVERLDVVLRADRVDLSYVTRHGRGRIRLALWAPRPHDDVLDVPLDATSGSDREAPDAEPSEPRRRARLQQPTAAALGADAPGFTRHLSHALAALLGGFR